MTIRVLIADDQEMVRAGFKLIIDRSQDMEVVADVDNGRDAVTTAHRLRPDVCLLDIRMPGLDGIEATRELAGPKVADPFKVVIITTFDLDEYVHGALQAGATGFLLKNAGPELLIEAIRAADNGEALISPAITSRLLRHMHHGSGSERSESDTVQALTEREEEVILAVATGLTNAEIAESLHVSLSTAKAHVASLLTKLGARNRVELVIWAYETGRMRG